jgi:xanthine/uracil permease
MPHTVSSHWGIFLATVATEAVMTDALHAVAWFFAAVLCVWSMIALVRWAKTNRIVAPVVGSALVLLLGAGLVPRPPQTVIEEEAREEKGRKGAESGAPPPPDAA